MLNKRLGDYRRGGGGVRNGMVKAFALKSGYKLLLFYKPIQVCFSLIRYSDFGVVQK